ncbi:hypothetical protein BDR04DRAFT_1145178 [Suillus decipiens]|nr:hypothetical protein BDR04DRAFT_1145178 [Suillus decipiens]
MASACSFYGVVGTQSATPYTLEPKQRFWKMNGFMPASVDSEDSVGDPVSVFTFTDRKAPQIDSQRNRMFFIGGRPGRVKTLMVNVLSSTLHASGHIILTIGNSALLQQRINTVGQLVMFGIPTAQTCILPSIPFRQEQISFEMQQPSS